MSSVQRITRVVLLLGLLVLFSACNDDPGLPDTGALDDTGGEAADTSASGDGGGEDAGGADTQGDDAGVADGGDGADTGSEDAGLQDTGADDIGTEDTGVEDTGAEDAGVEDTGVEDTGVEDTGVEDTGVEDTGSADAGADAGQVCSGPNPAGCDSNKDCASDEVCRDDPNSCDPSTCQCNASTGQWVCTKDCGGTVCMKKQQMKCTKPDPSGCDSARDCPAGYTCQDDPNSCDPSSCMCDMSTGQWLCTRDCGGTVCMPKSNACPGPNPAGCQSDGDCPGGQVCRDDPNSCDPSTCGCDQSSGRWRCTADCNGSVCMSP